MTNDRIVTGVKTLGGNDPWAQGQSFQTVEQLQAQIATLTAENERLRALVETGYEEGWEDATCQPMGFEVNWNHSQTRAALQPKEGEI